MRNTSYKLTLYRCVVSVCCVGFVSHAAKCNIMRVSRTRDPKLFSYSLTGQVLEEVMDAKYLGVTLNNDLEWSKHIATMTNKANSTLSFLRRKPEGLPREA